MNFLLNHTPLLYFVQSFWRDESFSVLFAQLPFIEIFKRSVLEPPFYYLLLHVWTKLFGTSEIAARSLSLVGFSLATVVMIEWSDKLFKKHWLRIVAPLLFFLTPQLLYYAFEVRAYAWYIFFTTASLALYSQKQWKWYRIATILGCYTHYYFGIVPLVQFIHYLLRERRPIRCNVKKLIIDPMIQSMIIIFAAVLPQLIRVVLSLSKFRESWYFPVDFHLIKSVLGNMFLGYEGTPWYFWNQTAWLSLVLFILFLFAGRRSRDKSTSLLLLLLIFVPLTIIIGISFIKPLFVNRYLLPVTVGETLLLCLAVQAISSPKIQKVAAAVILFGVIGFNVWYPNQHGKIDMRTPLSVINNMKQSQDFIYADDPLTFFDTLYYAKDRSKVFLYNPNHTGFPWYIGEAIFSNTSFVDEYPRYPKKAFVVESDGTFAVHYSLPAINGGK